MTETCNIGGCDRPVRVKSRGWCIQHYNRWHRTGDVGGPNFGVTGPNHHHWSGSSIGYRGAHDRVRRARGKASEHTCLHCGDPAATWAYDESDPDQIVDAQGRRYSADPTHYLALCAKCHTKFDGRGFQPGNVPSNRKVR